MHSTLGDLLLSAPAPFANSRLFILTSSTIKRKTVGDCKLLAYDGKVRKSRKLSVAKVKRVDFRPLTAEKIWCIICRWCSLIAVVIFFLREQSNWLL